MKKNIFVALIFAFVSAFVFSENSSLREVSESLSKNKVTKGDFVLTKTSPKTSREMKSSGKFTIASEYGIIWYTEKPVKNTQVFTESHILTENAKGTRTVIDGSKNLTFSEMAKFISALFTGNYSEIEKKCKVDFSDEGNGIWKLKLIPEDETLKAVMKEINVEGKAAGNRTVVTTMEMLQTDGTSAKYEMTGHGFADEITENENGFFK